MPWLIKNNTDPAENLFFVHVPRCGGTSLMHHYNVPQKAMEGRSWGGKLGMIIFFRRYRTLESANFPWKTKTSLICLLLAAVSIYVLIASGGPSEASLFLQEVTIGVTSVSLLLFVCLSFIFTAPTIGRLTYVRRAYLLLIHHVLCRFMESIEWCTGTNKTGYMMHLTATKLLQHEYLSKQELEETTTMAIVRNPYSRMVSIYNYNKFGSAESFDAFVQDWYHRMTKPYRETGELDEWYTPCHTIPQFEFTHSQQQQGDDTANSNKPLVQCIIKQEELKLLKKMNQQRQQHGGGVDEEAPAFTKSSVSNLPEIVRRALLDMPHTNSRAGGKKWHEYYTQETLDLVYEMYQKDFEVFGYSPILKQRSDLNAPKLLHKTPACQQQDEESATGRGTTQRSEDHSNEFSEDGQQGELEDVPLDIVGGKSSSSSMEERPPQLQHLNSSSGESTNSTTSSSSSSSSNEDEDEDDHNNDDDENHDDDDNDNRGGQSRFDLRVLDA